MNRIYVFSVHYFILLFYYFIEMSKSPTLKQGVHLLNFNKNLLEIISFKIRGEVLKMFGLFPLEPRGIEES
jgi:hypothetical protein